MSTPGKSRSGLYGSAASKAAIGEAFTSGELPVAVYGLGKMGLPLAAVYADVSGNTVGADVDPAVVETVERGDSPVTREPGLAELVEDVVGRGALRATESPAEAASEATIHVIVVPTLLADDERPDLSMLDAVTGAIGEGLSSGDLVIVESTVPPRTTADRLVPRLSSGSGIARDEFGAAACPERTVSGQALADIRGTHPKIVGGVDGESTRAAGAIYEEITANDVIEAGDATTAEAVKVFEGVYRDVNIALANQLALFAREMKIAVTEAIEIANTQPFCEIHSPGPGVGGHCIPVYPHFLSGAFDADSSLLDSARRMNDRMPEFTVSMLESVLGAHGVELSSSEILLLGMTYKAGIDELRNAPAVLIAEQLREQGAAVLAADPVLSDWGRFDGVERVGVGDLDSLDPDGVVLTTPHREFRDLDWEEFDAPILDGRGAIDSDGVDAPVYKIGGKWP